MTDEFLQDLGEGLVLRRSCLGDAEPLAKFNAEMHGDNEADARAVADWTRDLLSGQHPTFGVDDCTIVEDTRSGRIISSCNLISQTWAYEGVPFKMGRPELVATLPEYRRRGLIRFQFEVLHRWSQERGELVQAITGIPYYYRQFGYEMGLNLGGGRIGFQAHVPELPEGQVEPYCIRKAVEADLPFIARCYEIGCKRSALSAVWNADLWRYELLGKRAGNVNRLVLYIIENRVGDPVGFLAHSVNMWQIGMNLNLYELLPDISYLDVTPSVIRFIWTTGQSYAAQAGRPCTGFYFWLGEEHPCYPLIAHRIPRVRIPYAWYVRVPDLAAFLKHIAPALEKRLEASACHNYSSEVKLSFYRSGLRLVFDQGHLVTAENLPQTKLEGCSSAFPDLTFLQLVFGYRSLDEIRYAFADCWCNEDNAKPLLEALFPRRPSDIWPIS